MKKILLAAVVVFFMLSMPALAAELVEDSDKQAPEAEQSKPSLPLTTQSNNLDRAMTDSWGTQKAFFIMKNLSIIDWAEAKTILKEKRIMGGKQYHTGWVTIYTINSVHYLTKPPKIDALFQFLKENKLSSEWFGTE
ncbi:MAG: hypothetical protein WC695_08920 [Candidatus Omnitrophota bacterium]